MKFTKIIKYIFVWQLAVVLVTLFSQFLLPYNTTFLGVPLDKHFRYPQLYSRANFDGIHYVLIAQFGYHQSQQAFFPLYPKLINLINPLFSNWTISGVIISLISFIIAVYILNRLLLLDYNPKTVHWVITALLFFPVSFFFSAVYTESLFLLFSLLSFFCARKKQWALAGIFGGLSAYTRLVGVLLFPALIIEFWQQNKKNWLQAIFILLIPLALGLYMFYQNQTTGDPLAFIHSQPLFNQGRSEKMIMLYQVFWRYFKMLISVDKTSLMYLSIVLEFIVGVVLFITSSISIWKIRPSYAIYGFMAFLLPTLSGTFGSLPRYALVCFPSFILIGILLEKSGRLTKILMLGLFGFGFVLFTTLFVRGYWVS